MFFYYVLIVFICSCLCDGRGGLFKHSKSLNPFSRSKNLNPFSRSKNLNPFSKSKSLNPFSKSKSLNPFTKSETQVLEARTLLIIPNEAWKHQHKSFIKDLNKILKNTEIISLDTTPVYPSRFQYNGALIYENVIISDVDKVLKNKEVNTLLTTIITSNNQENNMNLFVLGIFDANNFQHYTILRKKLSIVIPHEFAGSELADSAEEQDEDFHIVTALKAADVNAIISDDLELAYHGIGHTIDPTNTLSFTIFAAEPTTYIRTSSGKLSSMSGPEIKLISGLQTRSNRRFLFTASSDVCSDLLYKKHPPNRKICKSLIRWFSKQKGHFKIKKFLHSKADFSTPDAYIINDNIEVFIDLIELDEETLLWKPFEHIKSTQLEYKMLVPYYRKFLNNSRAEKSLYMSENTEGIKPGQATAIARLQCPTTKGIFKFIVRNYIKGYTFLHFETLAPIIPPRHDAPHNAFWKALPFYTSTFCSLGSAIILIVLMIHSVPSNYKFRSD